jgi:hypothetical protein
LAALGQVDRARRDNHIDFEPDSRRLLRSRRERPCSGRAAEQGDEPAMNADWHKASINYALQNVSTVTTTDAVIAAIG